MIEKYRKYILPLYLFLLGSGAGITIALGAFSAPVIFNASDFVAFEIDRFSSGLIMTQIFIKSNYFLNVVAIFIAFFEIHSYRYTPYRDWKEFTLGIICVVSILSFTLYYTPLIVDAQKIGSSATSSESFEVLHKYAELDYSIILFSLSALLILRVYNILKR